MGHDILDVLTKQGIEGTGRLYSVYRAIVVNNEDPAMCNRLKVNIPGVYGGITTWALPRNQHGSFGQNLEGQDHGNGFKYLPPKVGDIVWVSFAMGDPTSPIWEYYGWSENQIPVELQASDSFGFVTPNGNKIIFSEDNGTMDIYLYGDATVYSKKRVNLMAENSVNIIAGADRNSQIVIDNDKIHIKFSNSDILMEKDKITVNGGNNLGVVNISDITTKLNKLVQELEVLRNTVNTHTHTGMHGPTSPPLTQVTSPFSQFNKADYEDKKLSH